MNNNISNRKLSPFFWLNYIFSDWDRTQLTISILLLGVIALAPFFIHSPYYLGIIILATLYAYIGISWNIVAGFAGQLLIAHVIFLAFGAYTTIVLFNTYGISPWIGLIASGITASILGLIVAFISLRYGLKADYFALFTIALMVGLKTLFLKWDLVGGSIGMWLTLGETGVSKMIFKNKEPYLYISLLLVLFGLIVQYLTYQSKMGKYFIAIREDEDAAAAIGVNTSLYKTLALFIGSGLAGIGGGFYVMYVGYVEPPQVFNLGFGVEIALAGPIIGGLGSLLGPLLGSLLFKPFADLSRGILSTERSGSSLIVYGSFLIIAILFMPKGLTGIVHSIYLKYFHHSSNNQGG